VPLEQALAIIQAGGVVGLLVLVIAILLRGDVVTKATVAAVAAGNAALVAELVKDRDDWKAIAKQATTELGELAEALTIRNRIDEEMIRTGARRSGT